MKCTILISARTRLSRPNSLLEMGCLGQQPPQAVSSNGSGEDTIFLGKILRFGKGIVFPMMTLGI